MINQLTQVIQIIVILHFNLHILNCFPTRLACSEEPLKSQEVDGKLYDLSMNTPLRNDARTFKGLPDTPEANPHLRDGVTLSVQGIQSRDTKSQVYSSKGQSNVQAKPHGPLLKAFLEHTSFKRKASKKGKNKIGVSKEPSKNSQSNFRNDDEMQVPSSQQNMLLTPGDANNSGLSHKMDIRNLPHENMNKLCIQFTKYFSELFEIQVRQQFISLSSRTYPLEVLKIWDKSTLAPMIYFLLLRNPTKSQWDRIQTISAFILVGFYEMDSKSAMDPNSEKRFQFLLWHTEMMYHLTNPNLLHYVNEQEENWRDDDLYKSHRTTSKLSRILLLLANQTSFIDPSRRLSAMLDFVKKHLSSHWQVDYSKGYPFQGNSNGTGRVLKDEWMKISRKIAKCPSFGSMEKYSPSEKPNERIMSEESLKAIFGNNAVQGEFGLDLKKINKDSNGERIK